MKAVRRRHIVMAFVFMLAGALALWFQKPALYLTAAALGRSPYCSLSNILAAPANFHRFSDYGRRYVARRCRRVLESPDLARWETPLGTFWRPAAGDSHFLAEVIEQSLQIYGTGKQAVQPGDVVFDCGRT